MAVGVIDSGQNLFICTCPFFEMQISRIAILLWYYFPDVVSNDFQVFTSRHPVTFIAST